MFKKVIKKFQPYIVIRFATFLDVLSFIDASMQETLQACN